MVTVRVAGSGGADDAESVSFVLPESENELRQMIAALPGMLWTANPLGLYDFVSPQWLAATGRRLFELLGSGWLQAVHADDRQRVSEQWQYAVRHPSPVTIDLRLCAQDGQSRWFTLRGTPIVDPQGRVERWFGLCLDTDDFRRTQQALQESQLRYQVLFENRINGVVQLQMLYDEQGMPHDMRIVKVNQAYNRILGLENEEVEGRLASELFPGIRGSEPDYVALYGKIARESGEASFETEFTFASKWLRVYAYSAIPDECIAIFSDITAQKQMEFALRQSEERLRLIIDNLAEGLIVVSPDGKTMHWNKTALELHGYAQSEERLTLLDEIAKDYEILTPEGQTIPFDQWPVPRLLRGESLRNVEAILRNVRDHWAKEVSFGGTLVKDDEGRPLMGLLTIRDITVWRRAERARGRAERRLQLAIDIAHLGSWEWSMADGSVYFSPQWKRLIGCGEDELPNHLEAWESRLHPADRARALSALHDYARHPEGTFQSEYRMQHRDGDYRWMTSRAIAEFDDNGEVQCLVGTMLDVTRQKLEEQRVREAAQHCPLTGLPNRALIFEYANHLLAAASRKHSRGALLFIDLDRFKPVNDLHGHDIGDRLLKDVAQRMAGCVRQEDLVGRLGGDEFVIVLPYLGKGHTAPTVARHVIDALSQPFHISGLELSISASVGISFYPTHGTDVDSLLHRADLAMYRAKQSGRGHYQVYTPELRQRGDASASVEAQIRRGLAENLFTLYYQPVVNVGDGSVAGVEALLRLPAVKGDMIAPATFIPVAESSGMIAQLGDWVTEEVCRQWIDWRDKGMPPIRIAMNISTLQFRQRGFAARLLNIVRHHGVDPACLQIELTESSLAERVSDAMETLTELHAAGMQIALDDLGTGWSSLNLISHLPLDKLKVDRIFVSRLQHDNASKAVAEVIIAMGKAMDLEIVGEGVDSQQTLDYLRSHGCQQVQGNLLGEPMPPADFVRWYAQHSPSMPAHWLH